MHELRSLSCTLVTVSAPASPGAFPYDALFAGVGSGGGDSSLANDFDLFASTFFQLDNPGET